MDIDNEIKYLGIDWGQSKIGLALGSNITKMATPYQVVGSLSEVLSVISNEEIDVIVLGVPIKMSGSDRNLTPGFNTFKHALESSSGVDIKLTDERLSTKLADRLSRGEKTAKQDAIAAMLILQTYLDQN
ncbi:MAG: Holliday junction resolvase RuvX [bacterium]